MMLELIAEIVHEIWMGWAQTIMKSEVLTASREERWKKCFVPYADLPEEMKDLDRKFALKIMNVVKKHRGGTYDITNLI